MPDIAFHLLLWCASDNYGVDEEAMRRAENVLATLDAQQALENALQSRDVSALHNAITHASDVQGTLSQLMPERFGERLAAATTLYTELHATTEKMRLAMKSENVATLGEALSAMQSAQLSGKLLQLGQAATQFWKHVAFLDASQVDLSHFGEVPKIVSEAREHCARAAMGEHALSLLVRLERALADVGQPQLAPQPSIVLKTRDRLLEVAREHAFILLRHRMHLSTADELPGTVSVVNRDRRALVGLLNLISTGQAALHPDTSLELVAQEARFWGLREMAEHLERQMTPKGSAGNHALCMHCAWSQRCCLRESFRNQPNCS